MVPTLSGYQSSGSFWAGGGSLAGLDATQRNTCTRLNAGQDVASQDIHYRETSCTI